MPRYRLTRRADRKLEAIYRYTFETFGAAQADAYFAALGETFGLLAERPPSCGGYGDAEAAVDCEWPVVFP